MRKKKSDSSNYLGELEKNLSRQLPADRLERDLGHSPPQSASLRRPALGCVASEFTKAF